MNDRRAHDYRGRYHPRGASPERIRKKSPTTQQRPKRDYSPNRPRDYSPNKPRDYSPNKPRDYSPNKPRDYSPNKPRDYSPGRYRVSPPRRKSPSRQDANRSNLHVWGKWRTEVNENLISDFFYTTNRRDRKKVQPLETLIKDEGVYNHTSNVDQTRGLLNYSLSTNRVTDLEPNDFLRYGIPRVKLNSANKLYKKLFPTGSQTLERNLHTMSSPAQHSSSAHARDTTLNRDHLSRLSEEPRSLERSHNGIDSNENGSVNYFNRSADNFTRGGSLERSLARGRGHDESYPDGSRSAAKDVAFTPRTDYSRGDTARGDPGAQPALYSQIPLDTQPPATNHTTATSTHPAPPLAPPPPPLPASIPLPYQPKKSDK